MRQRSVGLGFLLAALAAGGVFAQEAQQPSRKEILEHDGIIWASPAVWRTPFEENLGENAKIAGLSRLWMEAKMNFPRFAEVADLDWDQTYLDFLPKVRATTSTYEYYRVLQQMCALLKDGHSNVFLPSALAERMEADLPLRIDRIENRVFVTRVESKTLAAEGVSEGLEILKIDGLPVQEYVEKNRRPYIASNSPQHTEVQLYSYGLLSGPLDRPVTVEFRSPDGHVFEKRLTRGPRADARTLPAFEFRKLDGNIAYVALNTFNSEDVQKEFESHLAEIRGSDGLILDVRQNDGGSGVIAYNLIGYLTAEDFTPPSWKTRQYIATLRVWGEAGGWWEPPKPTLWPGKRNESYTKPVVLLIGPRSLSATDVFAETFQRLRRGLLIGEPTGGSTGDPLAFSLPGGGSARVSTSGDDTGMIGKGVQPDILVPRTAGDLLAGRDAALAAAVSALQAAKPSNS